MDLDAPPVEDSWLRNREERIRKPSLASNHRR